MEYAGAQMTPGLGPVRQAGNSSDPQEPVRRVRFCCRVPLGRSAPRSCSLPHQPGTGVPTCTSGGQLRPAVLCSLALRPLSYWPWVTPHVDEKEHSTTVPTHHNVTQGQLAQPAPDFSRTHPPGSSRTVR